MRAALMAAGLAAVWGVIAAAPAQAAGACLSMPLIFETGTAEGCPGAARLAELMEAPLAVGPRDDRGRALGVELALGDGSPARRVRTCAAYVAALEEGYAAQTQLAMNAEGFMRVACGSLLALAASAKAGTSRFEAEGVGLETLALLPPDMLPALAPDTEAALAELTAGGFTVGSMVGVGEVMTRAGREGQLDLAYGGVASTYGEVARGDFNGDGAADLLVFARHAAVEGSLRWYELFALGYPAEAVTYVRFAPDGTGALD